MKNILTKKAMTLFELLAVVVILGIILAIGFPTVNRLITNSRKDAFAANVNSYISAAKTDALAEFAAKGEPVNNTYSVVEEEEGTVYETFGLDVDDFTAGAINIEVDKDGNITITLIKDFVGKGFKTNLSGFDFKEPITRDHVEDSED